MEEYRAKTMRNQSSAGDAYGGLERRIERVERSLNICDEISLVKKDQEETRQFDIDRRLDAIDNRLRRIEQIISNIIIDLDEKIEQHDNQISSLKQIPVIKSELEDLKCAFYADERIAALEKEINLKMFKMFETVDELSRSVGYKEKEIERLKREIEDLRNENEKYIGEREQQNQKINDLINQMEMIWTHQEAFVHQSKVQRATDETLDEEELFLKRLRTGGYAFQ